MNKITFLLLLLWHIVPCYSQVRICSTNEHYNHQVAVDQLFAQKQGDIEQFTRHFENTETSTQADFQRGTIQYKIPVVVHVVYNTTLQNITDAQVQSQIDALNRDYQLLNSDTISIPTAFKPFMADCKIQFCLAQRDPAGYPTTGIVRKATARVSFTDNDDVKQSSKGGDDAWDANSYLNLWVCKLSGGLLGYAQFPGGSSATDGVVISYTAFGTTGTAAAPFNIGRTATHEIGHWLNLKHIWGDDGSACAGSDGVGDTPNQSGANYHCPAFPVLSCNSGTAGDMFMNYMDYVDDRCMMMFTHGQRKRMYAVLAPGGARASLAVSLGCTSATSSGCQAPTRIAAGNITQTSAEINWGIVPGAASYALQYKPSSADTFTTVKGITSASYNLINLKPASTYKFRVQALCSIDGVSYSGIQSFTTADTGTVPSRDAFVGLITGTSVNVYPVPATTYIIVSLNQFHRGAAQVILSNAIGTTVIRSSIQIEATVFSGKVDVSRLSSGMYFLKIRQGKRAETARVIICR